MTLVSALEHIYTGELYINQNLIWEVIHNSPLDVMPGSKSTTERYGDNVFPTATPYCPHQHTIYFACVYG